MHRIVVLALEPVVGFDATIPPQVFGAAEDADGTPLYDVVVCGLGGRPVRTLSGYSILPQADESALATADTLVVPGTTVPGPRRHGTLDPELAAAFALLRPGTRVMSICTGAFVLAAAGLLSGRPATTHWDKAADFRRLHPDVELDEDLLFVDDGDVLTSAGLAAGVDLCLHVVRSDHGSEVANRTARYCVVAPVRPGGQAQFIERPLPPASGLGTGPTRAWALEHLAEPLALADLAAHAATSVRTFTRRFRAETGSSPGEWLVHQRVERARHLLETTTLSVEAVASACGLGGAAALRHHLAGVVGLSPTAYRRTFAAG
ncbi:GlxA family transcriptional regulator [Kineococcus rubinsiae]|uniref:GlxA family transcriptional regulator n=1 Tax=Kineococcus rubinsiae TaxID=2609562 RepID=UPI001430A7BD|nr:helix-turn-helix domain-containing protein [Kineococcus rubinsiae]NIZ93568.1 helix-turn-helix domain-containing protein [Kineococcus rubinsiae]